MGESNDPACQPICPYITHWAWQYEGPIDGWAWRDNQDGWRCLGQFNQRLKIDPRKLGLECLGVLSGDLRHSGGSQGTHRRRGVWDYRRRADERAHGGKSTC